MAGFFKFERLEVWRRSVELANQLFDVAQALPKEYQYSLGEQLRRAALSVPTNIAEGVGRDNPNESAYFYRIAKGSVYEVVSLLVMCGKRNCLTHDQYRQFHAEANTIAGMLTALTNAT